MSNVKIAAQYIKDLSFEVPKSPDVFLNPVQKPDIGLAVDIDAKKLSDTTYESVLTIKADADSEGKKGKIFICEVQYAGIFNIENIDKEMLEQVLLVFCPNLLFPFARRIISNLTMDSGFAPLMLDPIDFNSLYLQRKETENKEDKKGSKDKK